MRVIDLGPDHHDACFCCLEEWSEDMKDVGDLQGRGMGEALLAAAEEDARARGAKGMAAWGLSLPFWMKAAWFKKTVPSVRFSG